MNGRHTGKKVMAYILMPLLFCVAGYGILYFALSPIVSPYLQSFDLFLSAGGMDSANSAADVPYVFDEKTSVKMSAGDTVDEKQVQMPAYGALYAKFEIDNASISAGLYFGDNSACLKKGLGQFYGSSIPGYGKPILIGGHNNGTFNRLQYVKAGDIAKITTNYGVYQYKVTDTRIAQSTDKTAFDLKQNDEQLILYTCYPFNTLGLTSERYFVYAEKIAGPVIVSDSQE